ncbi:DMT family transporter [Flavobacterium salilacus subsp. salilacus]|uniref:DMT family transporter n=1 Tax=Flavobacterium TaxID=237 RepID=UPI00107532DC|nr:MULTISPECIES: DMT family transporter [Flavobacterium]KAF2519677.1 DMT family transporter [Flavobacterium salilacus subsp. salilacus]MBE1614436.1 DMT family transporter [Flavobacterium sp. SaA2.13]NDI97476.1 DMT family transporter [Flavobacterium salilacus subsp. altitudinum]
MLSDNQKSYLQLHFIVFIWGFTAVLGALISLDALPLVWFRMSIAVLIILLYIFIKRIPLKIPPKTLIGFLIAGLIIALHWLTFFKAIKVSNVSVTLACLSTGAFFTSLLEPVFFGRKIIWYEVVFGLLVVAGLYLIFRFEGNYIDGIILALTSAFLSAVFSIINGKYAKLHNPSVISLYELFGGVLFLSVYLLFAGSFTAEFFQVSATDWIWLFALGSFCTAYAFIVSVDVMKFLSPYTVMLTINLEPVYGIILALIVFKEKEKMSWTFYIGAAIIITTVIMNGVLKKYTKTAK